MPRVPSGMRSDNRPAARRADLGSYLGLTAETVTRELTTLRTRGIISLSGKNLQIHDVPGLVRLAIRTGLVQSD